MHAPDQTRSGEAGLTLVELLVASTLLLAGMFVALGIFDLIQRGQPQIAERNADIQRAQIETERLVRELRQSSDVVAAAPNSLTVETYLPRGTACGGSTSGDARLCRVTYSCSGGTCTRTAAETNGTAPGPTTQIIDGLSSSDVFSYSPDSTDPLSVTVTMTLPSPADAGEDSITLTDGVVFRNVAGAVGS